MPKSSQTPIEAARRALGLKAYEAADKLGLSASYYSEIEKGKKPVPDKSLAKFSEVFGEAAMNSYQQWALAVANGELEQEAADQVEGLPPRSKLKALRIRKGISVKEMAEALGYRTIGVYQDIEEGRSQMGEKMALRAADFLGIDVAELLNGSDEPPARGGLFPTFGTLPNIVMGPGMEGSKTKNVPLISMAQCGAMGAYSDEVYTRGGFPAIDCDDPRAFAVTLAGDSMEPTHKAGDVAVVCPSDSLRNEDLVLVKIKEGQGPHSGDVMFKLYQATRDQVTLSSYNPSFPPTTWPRTAFEWIYRVQGVTRLYPKRRN